MSPRIASTLCSAGAVIFMVSAGSILPLILDYYGRWYVGFQGKMIVPLEIETDLIVLWFSIAQFTLAAAIGRFWYWLLTTDPAADQPPDREVR